MINKNKIASFIVSAIVAIGYMTFIYLIYYLIHKIYSPFNLQHFLIGLLFWNVLSRVYDFLKRTQ